MAGGTPRRVSIGRWTERSHRPVYALDRNRVVVYANAACLNWLDAKEETVVGRRCDYHSLPSADSVMDAVAGLCPPPDLLNAPQGQFLAWRASGAGPLKKQVAHFWQMGGAESPDWLLVLLVEAEPVETTGNMVLSTDPKSMHLALVEAHRAWVPRFHLDDLVGTSPGATRVRRQVELAASHGVNVVVSGPRGSGRERVARTIHQMRMGDASPTTLIPLDCQLLDAELLQGTLVGFIRSSSELIESGAATLLLLDADQMQSATQAVLIEMLSVEAFALTTLATASTPLLQVDRFDVRLASRLSTLEIKVPSLQDRLEDLPLLVQAAIESANSLGRHQVSGMSSDAIDALWAHPWRRNLDELWEVVAEAHRRCSRTIIGTDDLPEIIRLTADAENYPPIVEESVQLDSYLLEVERTLLLRTLDQCQGNRAKAARRLGISRAKFLRRLQIVQGTMGIEGEQDDVGMDES